MSIDEIGSLTFFQVNALLKEKNKHLTDKKNLIKKQASRYRKKVQPVFDVTKLID